MNRKEYFKNKIKVKGKEFDTLIVTGCSHTQGCAFTDNELIPIDENTLIELATPQLKKKYGKDKVTSKFITENLTWGGKLNKFIKAKKLLNFAFGGYGIESCIRSLRSYIFKKHRLDKHLVIIQIPSPIRKEIIWRKKGFQPGEASLTHVKTLCEPKSPAPYREMYYEYYTDFASIEGNFIHDLYHLQNYLENLGAVVRLTDLPFQDWSIVTRNQILEYGKIFSKWGLKGYEQKLTQIPELQDVFNHLNIIKFENELDLRIEGESKKRHTLNDEGLFKGDFHLSEKGNEKFAEGLWSNIDNIGTAKEFPYLPPDYQLVRKQTLL